MGSRPWLSLLDGDTGSRVSLMSLTVQDWEERDGTGKEGCLWCCVRVGYKGSRETEDFLGRCRGTPVRTPRNEDKDPLDTHTFAEGGAVREYTDTQIGVD